MEQLKCVIFRVPPTLEELSGSKIGSRHQSYCVGSYNHQLVSQILEFNGFDHSNDEVSSSVIWKSSPEIDSVTPSAFGLQKINHFPYSKQILGNKAQLAKILQSNAHLRDFRTFFPITFILPGDRDSLFYEMRSNSQQLYICKPPKGSCGRGIQLLSFNEFYKIPPGSVVSQYISRPLEIDSFKFDLRIYVLVTSFAPLRAFIFKEGLARFATETYSKNSTNPFSALTNATLNKHGPNWCSDFKWKLSELLSECEHRYHKKASELMEQIKAVVSQTLALVQPSMAPSARKPGPIPFFELYGFDILFDKDFRAWLLEINTFPSLGLGETVDYEVKASLIAQTLSIAGVFDTNANSLEEIERIIHEEAKSPSKFEAVQVELENRRNELSGGGFIRIFPSDDTQRLLPLLSVPKFAHTKPIEKKEPQIDPEKLGHLLTREQGMEILVSYLTRLEATLDDRDPSLWLRIGNFLNAQGYQTKGGIANMRLTLRLFIKKSQALLSLTGQNSEPIPQKVRKYIVDCGDAFVMQLLENCNLGSIKKLNTLFEICNVK